MSNNTPHSPARSVSEEMADLVAAVADASPEKVLDVLTKLEERQRYWRGMADACGRVLHALYEAAYAVYAEAPDAAATPGATRPG